MNRDIRCVYGSPSCQGVSFRSVVGARQHWSCFPGRVFSAVATGLKTSTPDLRDDDRALLASVAAWAAIGAVPALVAEIATEGERHGASVTYDAEARRALKALLETVTGADISAEVAEAGRQLVARSLGHGPSSPQSRVVSGVTELQLKRVSGTPTELARDPSGVAYVSAELGGKAQEALWVVPIDAAGNARSVIEVAVGAYHSTPIPVSPVLAGVLQSGTDLFWVAHNHPSGDTGPSQADVTSTEVLAGAAQVVGLHLVDHKIVGPGRRCTSLVDAGLRGGPRRSGGRRA